MSVYEMGKVCVCGQRFDNFHTQNMWTPLFAYDRHMCALARNDHRQGMIGMIAATHESYGLYKSYACARNVQRIQRKYPILT